MKKLVLCLWATLSACAVSRPEAQDAELRIYPSLFADAGTCGEPVCRSLCSRVQCLDKISELACLANCARKCKNGFFDTANTELIACLEQSSSTCESTKSCCETHFTNTLCEL